MELPKEIFGVESNPAVVHATLVWHLAGERQGTASTKTKGEVRGGGKKPWKQKGTGRARAGSIRSPLWRGGGVIFGPKPRDYSYAMPKKARKLALRVVLSDKAREGHVKTVESIKLAAPKTKEMVKWLSSQKISGKTLIIVDKKEDGVERGTRNLQNVKLIVPDELNIHDLLKCDNVVLTKDAVQSLTACLQ